MLPSLRNQARKVPALKPIPTRHITSLVLVCLTLGTGELDAQQVGADDPSRPSMTATLITEPIRIDGRLDEAIWSEAPSYRGFVQKTPVEGAPAQNDSEVWILYDDDAVYMGAKVYDATPSTIARNMVRRDSNYNGQFDYFEVMFDPNLDQRTGYRFRVSPANVQTDRYLFDDGGEDANWDGVWTSGVTLTDYGWAIEMRIPLSQMRYEARPGEQTWGINFGRRRAADNELTRFALESALRPGRVSQFGLLTGIRIAQTPRRVEMRPYALTRVRNAEDDPLDPFEDGRSASAQVGVDVRYGLGTQFTLDATFNPDFGQVELDPAVINLTAFETFLDERRPFFVEDARIFDFRLSGGQNQPFYTRRIGRNPQGRPPAGALARDQPDQATILGAAKLTGRTQSGLSVGALLALTEEEEGTAAFGGAEQRTYVAEPGTGYGVMRLRQDLNAGLSHVGGIVTGIRRRLPSDGSFDYLTASAFSGGLDFEHNWDERTWALWGFFVGSHVRGDEEALTRIQRSSNHYLQRPDLQWSALDSTRTDLTGAEWRLQFEKRRGNWTGALWAAQVTAGFEINDIGFSRSRERLDGGARISYQDVEPGTYFRTWSVNAVTFQNWSHEALRDVWAWDSWGDAHTAGTFRAGFNSELVNFWKLNGSIGYTPDRVSRVATRGGPVMADPGNVSISVSGQTDNRRGISVRPNVSVSRGRSAAGNSLSLGASVDMQPTTQIEFSLEPRWERSDRGAQYVGTVLDPSFAPTFGARYLFADLDRESVSMVTRLNWTFTPKLTLQLYAQPLLSAGDYVTHKQLERPGSFDFDVFEPGTAVSGVAGWTCTTGRSCLTPEGDRLLDFDGDGIVDHSFGDRDFNLRSLRANAVLRWEYRPGSTIFFVWQHQRADFRTSW